MASTCMCVFERTNLLSETVPPHTVKGVSIRGDGPLVAMAAEMASVIGRTAAGESPASSPVTSPAVSLALVSSVIPTLIISFKVNSLSSGPVGGTLA